jgi:tRNA(Arg) A34 adenosine deaminase TadA
LIVLNGAVIAQAYNSQRADGIAVNHAEVKAVIAANLKLKSRKLIGAVAYCSCEPCAMCLTALSYANVRRIVFHQKISDLFPDDPQSRFDSGHFIEHFNFVPKLEQLVVA